MCWPAPVDGIRAQDRPFSCTSASVLLRGPEIDPRSVGGRSEYGRYRNEIEYGVEIQDYRVGLPAALIKSEDHRTALQRHTAHQNLMCCVAIATPDALQFV